MSKLIELNPDEKTFILKTLKDLVSSSSYLAHLIQEDSLGEDMYEVMPSLLESHLVDILKVLKYENTLEKERENRYKEARKLHEKIRSLENSLESNVIQNYDPKQLVNMFAALEKTIKNKWDNKENGLDGLVKLNVTGYRATIEFIPMFMNHSHNSETPETEKNEFNEFLEKLKQKGYQFAESRDELLFNDNNIKLVKDFITSIIPGIQISEIKNINYNNRYRIKSIIGSISLEELIYAVR